MQASQVDQILPVTDSFDSYSSQVADSNSPNTGVQLIDKETEHR